MTPWLDWTCLVRHFRFYPLLLTKVHWMYFPQLLLINYWKRGYPLPVQIAVDSKSQTNDLQYSDYNHSDSHSLSYYSLIIKKKAGHHKLKILIVMFCDLDFCNHIHSGSHVLLGPFGPTLTGLINILAEFAADYESGKLVKHVSTLSSLSSSLI